MRVPNHLPDFPVSSTTFPGKLWRLVNNNLFRSIQWSPEGSSVVINSNLFKSEVLSGGEYGVFKTTNFTSFVRQLNLYGFRKTNICSKSAGDDSAAVHYFQHTFFLRNRPDLLCNVRRSNSSNKGRKSCYENYNIGLGLYHQPLVGMQQHTRNGAHYSFLMTDDCLYPYYMNNINSNNNSSTSQHLSQFQMRSNRYSPYPGHTSQHQLYSENKHEDQASYDTKRTDTSSGGFPSLEETMELTALLSANGICLPRYQSSKGSVSSVSASMFPSNYAGIPTERIQRRYVVQEDIQTLCSTGLQDTNTLCSISELIRNTSKIPTLGPATPSQSNYSLPANPFIHQRYNLKRPSNAATSTPSYSEDRKSTITPEPNESQQINVETK